MSFDLAGKVFYGFELKPDNGANANAREKAYNGDFNDWGGNKTKTPCSTIQVGWHEPLWAIGIRSTFVIAKHGELAAFDFAAIDPAWDEQLRDWCAENGFQDGAPSWQVGAEYI